MNTEVLSGIEAIIKGSEIIRNGGLVAFPTETVYGLGANAYDEDAVKSIFVAKGRPQDNPLIVHISSKDQIFQIAKTVSPNAKKIIDAFMPGPITIVLKKSNLISDVVTAGLDSVGIRMPANEIARTFIEKSGYPIAAPSANLSTKISPTTAEHVYNDLKGRIPLIIDGGPCSVGIESTVLDLTSDNPIILRPGYITEDDINKVLNEDVKTFKGEVIKTLPSPGMKYKHYAPVVDTIVAKGLDEIIKEYDRVTREGRRPVIIASGNISNKLEGYSLINLGYTDLDLTKNIYSALHLAEKQYDYIIIEYLAGSKKKESIMNRILKAAAGKII